MPEGPDAAGHPSLGRLVEDRVVAVRSSVAELRLDLGAVHDTRVAVRQLRATLSTCAAVLDDVPDDLVADLRWFARQISASRDAEVVAGRLTSRLEDGPAEPARALREELDRWTAAASDAVRHALEAARTQALLESLGRLHLAVPTGTAIYLDLRAEQLAARAVGDLPGQLASALAGDGSPARRARRLHACRKQVKTVRAVVPLLGAPAEQRRRLAKALGRLQDLLGEHHDAHLTAAWLVKVAEQDPVAAELAAALGEAECAEADALEPSIGRAAERLRSRVEGLSRTPDVHLHSP